MRKILSFILCLAVVFCCVPAITVSAEEGWTLAQMQASFPSGKHWNHRAGQGHGYVAGQGWIHYGNCGSMEQMLFSVSDYVCYQGGVAPPGYYDCNTYYNKATQCQGFSFLMADLAYPGATNVESWGQTSNKNTAVSKVKPGDVIHYTGLGADLTYGHWVFVTGVSGSVVTLGESNIGSCCEIRWGRTLDIYAMTTMTLYSAPYVWNPSSSYTLDVNAKLDGADKGVLDGIATFDVYINGSLVANDVTDYFKTHSKGTVYEIKDVRTTGCFTVTGSQSFSGTLNSNADCRFIFETKHTLNKGAVTIQPTCTKKGVKIYSCSKCAFSETQEIAAFGHNYVKSVIPATCTENEKVSYSCKNCKHTYSEDASKNPVWSEWSTKKPDVAESKTETKKQYRYMQKETKLSSEPSIAGWTRVGKEWGEGKKTTVSYVSSFPAGFSRNNALYNQYNKPAPVSSENATTKIVVGDTVTSGYIYWHWCSSYYNGNSPINRLISDSYMDWDAGSQRPYNVFHAFYSTEYKGLTAKGAVDFYNSNACNQTYWWQSAIPVKSTTVTTYNMMYKFTRNTGWSEWSDTPVSQTDGTQFETRTLYRYRISGDVAHGHKWDSGVITKFPTSTKTGVKTYTCTACKATKTETVAKTDYLLGDTNADGRVTAADARLALRISAKLETPDNMQKITADVNFDKKINAADARKILRVSAKLETF
ncbi:MAG: hypothetical protein IKW03_08485 [Clostridia bacterium]|nr:hypothetical protein [Clostridia bacterium]